MIRFEAGQEAGDIGQGRDLIDRDFRPLGRGRDQRFESRRGAVDRFEDSGRAHCELLQLGGDDIVTVDVVAVQFDPGDVIERLRAAARPMHRDADRVLAVAGDNIRQEAHAPFLEQRFEIAVGRLAGLGALAGLQFGIGIDKDQRLAALQDKLVNREQCLLRQVLRMHQHQDTDVGGHRVELGADRLNLGELTQLLDNRHRPHRAAAHRRHDIAFERQARRKPDRGALRDREIVDEAGQIVFEEAFALRREEGDDLLIIGRVGAGEAKEYLLTLLVERHGLQAERDGTVLDIGEGLRVVGFEAQFATRRRDILVEQFAHTLGVDAVGRRRVAEAGRIIEAQCDRLVDARQCLAGTA